MEVSNIKFFRETREKMDNPVLDWEKKRNLKISRVKEFVRSKPSSTKFRIEELIGAAGYTTEQYNNGYSFIRNLNKSGIICIENTSRYWKNVTIPEDVKITKPEMIENPIFTPQESKKENEPKVVMFEKMEYEVLDVEMVRTIEKMAREFSWKNNSDSLREFVKSIK